MTTKNLSVVFSITFAAFLMGSCGGTDAAGPVLTGNFVDSPVAGVSYITPTESGVTNLDGEFSYREGEAVVFSIGKLSLPLVPASEMITPLDIADSDDVSDAAVINVARLLQSLDEDSDPSNGIVISESTNSVFDEAQIFDVADDNAVDILVDQAFNREREAVSAQAAMSHFIETLSENANSEESLGQLQYLVALNETYSGDTLLIDGESYELTRAGVTESGNTGIHNGVYQLEGGRETLFVSVEAKNNIKTACIAKAPKPVVDCKNGVYRVFEEEQLAMAFNSQVLTTADILNQPNVNGDTDTLDIAAATEFVDPESGNEEPASTGPDAGIEVSSPSPFATGSVKPEVSVSTDPDVDLEVSSPVVVAAAAPVQVAELTLGSEPDEVLTLQQAQTDSDVLAYFKFDDNTLSTNAEDSSGNGNDGVISGAFYVAKSGDGSPSSLDFDGIDDIVSLGGLDVSGTGITLSAWINANTFPGSSRDPRIISKATSSAPDDHVFMLGTTKLGDETVLRGRLRIEGVTYTVIADEGTSLDTGVWYHAAMVYDGSAIKLYLNGQEVGTKKSAGTIDQDSNVKVSIGANPDGLRNWDGQLDNVLIMQRPYNVSELLEITEVAPGTATVQITAQQVEAPSVEGTDAQEISTVEATNVQQIAAEINTAQVSNAAGCVAKDSANETISVLLIGNSLMRNVQSKLNQLLTCGGYSAKLATSNPAGYLLEEHLQNQKTLELIAEGYDLTLVQEKSRHITLHNSPFNLLNELKDKIEAAGSKMGFYQTWGFSNRIPDVTEGILSHYEYVADQFNAPIFHVGRAWDYYYRSNNEEPPFSLFTDTVHATDEGQTLIAYVLYAYLTGDSPINLTALTLADDAAFELQTIAWATYQSYN